MCDYKLYNFVADIDACSSGPCMNDGICVDGINGFTCTCAEGYAGTQCETGNTAYFNSRCFLINVF